MTSALIRKTYNDAPFVFREGGWFNMTKAAQHFGKEVHEFLRLPSTNEYVDALSKTGKYPELKVAQVSP